jgi:hypothetical protein
MRGLFWMLAVAMFSQATAGQVALTPELSDARGLQDWDLDGNGEWKVAGSTLVLERPGKPEGAIRRPAAIAVLRSAPFADVTLEVDLRSTAPADLAVRDTLLIFGYQSPAQFYYVHLSAKTDAVHNGIFVVNNADRRRIDQPKEAARLTDEAWHRVRLERVVETGRIDVFFDHSERPILSATDRTLVAGRVGVGSFDETAEFRAISVRGTAAR